MTKPTTAVCRGLAAGADVVIEAFGAGVAHRLGLGYDELRESNPGLVYTSITGFGHQGPFAHLKAYEAVVMAKTGSMYGNTVPHRPGQPVMPVPERRQLRGGLSGPTGHPYRPARAAGSRPWTARRCHHGPGHARSRPVGPLFANADGPLPGRLRGGGSAITCPARPDNVAFIRASQRLLQGREVDAVRPRHTPPIR